MKRVPTDREILERIYARYEPKYKEVSSGQDVEGSDSRIYLPVDLAAVATELNVDGNIVFGRLYYYLPEVRLSDPGRRLREGRGVGPSLLASI
jgi:hypothetical protein